MTPSPKKLNPDIQIIRELEIKMLASPNGRDQNESPKAALERLEQLGYADYLEQKGDLKGAEFFRLDDEIEVNKIREKRERLAVELKGKIKKTRQKTT
ncbi:MAG TPA: hypothetical protein VF556_07650 [Pyrinomonadaceae bacterium]|jgi:hypothetical protein